MCRRMLALVLVFVFASSAFASPPPSSVASPGAALSLSPEEVAQIRAALEASNAALKASSDKITQQSREITVLWISSVALLSAVLAEAVALVVVAVRR